MASQIEVPGTERKLSKKIRELGEDHAKAINAHTRAGVKKRDTKLALIAQMREEKVDHYRDTENDPPIDVKLLLVDKLEVKKYRAPEAAESEGETESKGKRGAPKLVKPKGGGEGDLN